MSTSSSVRESRTQKELLGLHGMAETVLDDFATDQCHGLDQDGGLGFRPHRDARTARGLCSLRHEHSVHGRGP